MDAQCSVNNCIKPISCRTLCRNHYQYYMGMNRKNTKQLTVEEYVALKLTDATKKAKKAASKSQSIGRMEYRLEREHFFE